MDARPLNTCITEMPDSNLPGIRDLHDGLGNFEWISIIDLADSYNQFPIVETDQEKTAFTWKGNHWMFTGVPFGLKIMTGHMQRVMETLLQCHGVQPFQDDVPIVTGPGGDHSRDVLKVLELLTYEARLCLRLTKCRFFQTEAKVLGSLLTRAGIRMDPLKMKAIVEWPRPVDGKAMQHFLRAANFHRDFSAKFAVISGPLEEVRNVPGPIEWTEERLKAFGDMKELFSQNLLLRDVN